MPRRAIFGIINIFQFHPSIVLSVIAHGISSSSSYIFPPILYAGKRGITNMNHIIHIDDDEGGAARRSANPAEQTTAPAYLLYALVSDDGRAS